MKPGDLVQIRVPNGWTPPEGVQDGQVGLILKISPIEYPALGLMQHDYIVLVNGSSRILKKRFLDLVYG